VRQANIGKLRWPQEFVRAAYAATEPAWLKPWAMGVSILPSAKHGERSLRSRTLLRNITSLKQGGSARGAASIEAIHRSRLHRPGAVCLMMSVDIAL
jgi:hypothetical protein